MVNISQLGLPQETRKIREIINTPHGQIEIYEPTVEEADAIIELERQEGIDFGEDRIQFDGLTVLKGLFPILTNINMKDLSDEELTEIIENPSIHLLIAQNIVAQIVSDVNKLYSERIKAEIKSAESVLSQAELIASIPSVIREQAKNNEELSELVNKVDKISDKIDVNDIDLDKIENEISAESKEPEEKEDVQENTQEDEVNDQSPDDK